MASVYVVGDGYKKLQFVYVDGREKKISQPTSMF